MSLDDHATSEEPGLGDGRSHVRTSTPCGDCGGRGLDESNCMTYAAAYHPGVTEADAFLCGRCRETGREEARISEDGLVDFATERLADRIPEILEKMKESAVKKVMES